jgi:hypothetical protein
MSSKQPARIWSSGRPDKQPSSAGVPNNQHRSWPDNLKNNTQLDIILLREDGTEGRPWLTAVIDDYSLSIAGYTTSDPIERVLMVNDADVISVEIVEAARDSLVIGQA